MLSLKNLKSSGSADAGIRLAEAVPRDMIAVPLGPTQGFAVVGAPSYFQDDPPPRTPADLMSHRCIRKRIRNGAIYRWEFEKRGEQLDVDVPGRLTFNEPTLITRSGPRGGGVGVSIGMVRDRESIGGPPRPRSGGLDTLLSGDCCCTIRGGHTLAMPVMADALAPCTGHARHATTAPLAQHRYHGKPQKRLPGHCNALLLPAMSREVRRDRE